MALLILYRALRPAWSHTPLSGAGAALYGGRWNRKATPALYLAFDAVTAMLEYNQNAQFHPATIAEYHLTDAKLCDLTDPQVLTDQSVPVSIHQAAWTTELAHQREPAQWTVVDRLTSIGFDGLIYPSARNKLGKALCLWRWNAPGAPSITVHDPEQRLPKDQSSWQ